MTSCSRRPRRSELGLDLQFQFAIGLLGLAVIVWAFAPPPKREGRPIDWTGAALLVTGLTALVLRQALATGPCHGPPPQF